MSGGSKQAKVVNYDASIERAQMQSRALELLQEANTQALISQKLAIYSGEQAKQDIQEGLGLLGEYLQDRNYVSEGQTPIYLEHLDDVTQQINNYAGKANSLFGSIGDVWIWISL